MLRLNKFGVSEEWFFTVLFNDDIWKELKKYMFVGKKTSNFYNYRDGDSAANHGYLSLIKENNNLVFTVRAIDLAAAKGYLEIIKWLSNKRQLGINKLAISTAIEGNYLEVVEYLYKRYYMDYYDLQPIIDTSSYGNLEIFKFLYRMLFARYLFGEVRIEEVINTVLSVARSNKRIDIIVFLLNEGHN